MAGSRYLPHILFLKLYFSHSNIFTVLSLALIKNEAVTVGGYWYNLGVVSLGNMVGGVLFVATPYIVAAKEKSK